MKKYIILLLLCCLTACHAQNVVIKGSGSCQGLCAIGATVVTVTTLTLPGGTQGSPYSQALAATGGRSPYIWSLNGSGTPPPGTTLSSGGVISGTPTTPGTFTFTVIATDQDGVPSSPRQLSIVIATGATLTINNPTPSGFANPVLAMPYLQNISVTGGTPPYTVTVNTGALPTGVTISGLTLTATSVGSSAGTPFTFSLHAADSAAHTFNSGNYTVTVISPSGPPNYASAGRAVINDNCVLQIPGGGPSTVGCPPTDLVLPNLGNGSSTGASTSAVDPQFNNILMTRCTDGSLGGVVTTSPFLNRPYSTGAGSSGDSTVFNPTSSLLAVIDTGNRYIIESIDTSAHTCYPVLTGSGGLYLPGSGEFGQTTGKYYGFFQATSYQVIANTITCASPGHAAGCTPPSAGTVAADFSFAFPQNQASAWASAHSYSLGNYVTAYLTNSQSFAITQVACAGGVATYNGTLPTSLNAGGLVNVSGLTNSALNGTALLVATNPNSTTITVNSGCSTLAQVADSGTGVMGSNVLFQLTSPTTGSCTSLGSAPAWDTRTLFITSEAGPSTCQWTASGTTNFTQTGGWSSVGGVNVAETTFSGGMSNNNFDTKAKGALNVTMSGTQNSGVLTYTYDNVADLFTEWNTGTGIVRTMACTASSGPSCTRGAAGVTVLGFINVTSTTPCGSTPCQFYIHNVKTYKGGAFNEVTPEFCTSQASGPGNCPASGKYIWQKGTTTANMAVVSNAGHETERYTHRMNTPAAGSNIAMYRSATAPNTVAPLWVNSNITQFDGHWGWAYLNGSTDDTTITPIGGTTFNLYDFPYSSPYENEVLIIPTCGVPSPVTSPACSASELQNSQVAREGHTFNTGTITTFNPQVGIGAFSQDGRVYAVSTDYACQFGTKDGLALLCGFPWSPSFTYANNAVISPTTFGTGASTNAGQFVYQNQSGSNCVSATVQTKKFMQTVSTTFTVTSISAPVVGQQTLTGTFPGGAGNAFGTTGNTVVSVKLSGFSHSVNNGIFLVGSSTATTLVIGNVSGVSDTGGTVNGPNTRDGTCEWVNIGAENQRSDVLLFWLQ